METAVEKGRCLECAFRLAQKPLTTRGTKVHEGLLERPSCTFVSFVVDDLTAAIRQSGGSSSLPLPIAGCRKWGLLRSARPSGKVLKSLPGKTQTAGTPA